MFLPFLFVEEKVWIISLQDKKEISNVVQLLASEFPLQELNHLKRVRIRKDGFTIDVIVGKVSDFDGEKIKCSLKNVHYDDLRIGTAPSRPSLNRWQYEFSSKLWPTNFYEDKKCDFHLILVVNFIIQSFTLLIG